MGDKGKKLKVAISVKGTHFPVIQFRLTLSQSYLNAFLFWVMFLAVAFELTARAAL